MYNKYPCLWVLLYFKYVFSIERKILYNEWLVGKQLTIFWRIPTQTLSWKAYLWMHHLLQIKRQWVMLENAFIGFRERVRERKRERETPVGRLLTPLTRDRTHVSGMCHNRKLNQQPIGAWDYRKQLSCNRPGLDNVYTKPLSNLSQATEPLGEISVNGDTLTFWMSICTIYWLNINKNYERHLMYMTDKRWITLLYKKTLINVSSHLRKYKHKHTHIFFL